jgi:hypothetical protein
MEPIASTAINGFSLLISLLKKGRNRSPEKEYETHNVDGTLEASGATSAE